MEFSDALPSGIQIRSYEEKREVALNSAGKSRCSSRGGSVPHKLDAYEEPKLEEGSKWGEETGEGGSGESNIGGSRT